MTTRTLAGTTIALILGASGLTAATTVATAPAGAETATVGAVANCRLADLELYFARRGHAAGSRLQTFRLDNTGDEPCRVSGFPRYRFWGGGHPIGFASIPAPGDLSGPVVLDAGASATSVLSWRITSTVPASQCRPRRVHRFVMRLQTMSGWFYGPLNTLICTTAKYRPRSGHLTPL
jgi:hypothetical protein